MTRYLSQSQAEKEYNIKKTTFNRWRQLDGVDIEVCKKGRRQTYRISEGDIKRLLSLSTAPDYSELYKGWQTALKSGTLTGKPVSLKTIENYEYGIRLYWKLLEEPPAIALLDAKGLRTALEKILPDDALKNCHYSKKNHIDRAVNSFVKYLVVEGIKANEEKEALSQFKPKRKFAPKRPTVSEDDFKAAIASNEEWQTARSDYDIAFCRILLYMLYITAMRRAELVDLKVNDIDLKQNQISIINGKGGKNRTIGIPETLVEEIKAWLTTRVSDGDPELLVTTQGKKVSNNAINKKLSRLADKIGINLAPHAFRRGSATRSIDKGVALSFVSKNLGHSKPSTTDAYLQTLDKPAMEAMKKQTHWDELSTNSAVEENEPSNKVTTKRKFAALELLDKDFKIF